MFVMNFSEISDQVFYKDAGVFSVNYFGAGPLPYYSDDVFYLGGYAACAVKDADQLAFVISNRKLPERTRASADNYYYVGSSYIYDLSAHESASGKYQDIMVFCGRMILVHVFPFAQTRRNAYDKTTRPGCSSC